MQVRDRLVDVPIEDPTIFDLRALWLPKDRIEIYLQREPREVIVARSCILCLDSIHERYRYPISAPCLCGR